MTSPTQMMRVAADRKQAIADAPHTPEGATRACHEAAEYNTCADLLERIDSGELIPVPRGLVEEYLQLLDGVEFKAIHAFVRKRAAETLLQCYEPEEASDEVQPD